MEIVERAIEPRCHFTRWSDFRSYLVERERMTAFPGTIRIPPGEASPIISIVAFFIVMPRLRRSTHALVVVYVALYSSIFVLSRMLIPPLNGPSYVFLRTCIGFVFLVAMLAVMGRIGAFFRVLARNLKEFLLLSFFITAALVLSFLGTQFTTPSNQSLLQNTSTILIILLNLVLFRIVPGKITVISATMTTTGILMVLHPLEFSSNQTIGGDLLMVCSAVFGALFTIRMDKVSKELSSIDISAGTSLFVILFTIPLFFLLDGPILATEMNFFHVLLLILLGIGITGVLYTVFPRIMGDPGMTSNFMGIIITLVPIFGTILGYLVYGGSMNLVNVIGAFVVIGGVSIMNLFGEKGRTIEVKEKVD